MVGFVASMNPICIRYYSYVIKQRNNKDLISGLNKYIQAKIIIYRDGVNDIQLLDVIGSELPVLNELCMKAQEGYDPKLAMTVVKKCGNARFFARNGRQLINPPPGTTIDYTITNQGL